MGKIYVLGSLNMDITYYVKKIPNIGMTVPSRKKVTAIGGKGLNQSFAAKWNGAETLLIGAVGKDANGGCMLRALEKFGIDTTYIAEVEKDTGGATILVDDNGGNLIVVDGGANQFVVTKAIDFQKGDWLVAQLETNIDAVEGYFRAAKQHGAHTMLNPSPYKALTNEMISLTDLFILNEQEASCLLGCTLDTAEKVIEMQGIFRNRGIRYAIVTLGEKGAVVVENNQAVHIQGKKVKAMDTQGAGDAFAGILVAELIQGKTLYEAACRANEIAGKCVEIPGSTILSLSSLKKGMLEECSYDKRTIV